MAKSLVMDNKNKSVYEFFLDNQDVESVSKIQHIHLIMLNEKIIESSNFNMYRDFVQELDEIETIQNTNIT